MNRPIFYIVDDVAININAIYLIEECRDYVSIQLSNGSMCNVSRPFKEVIDDISRLQGSHDHDYFDKVQTCIECALHNRP